MSKTVRWLSKKEAEVFNFKIKENKKNRKQSRYFITDEQWHSVLKQRTKPKKRKFVETQKKFDKNGDVVSSLEKLQSKPIDVPDGFEVIKISTSKTTGQQWVQYAPRKETASEVVESFDFKSVIQKYIKPVILKKVNKKTYSKDFDTLTYTDVHTGMDTDVDNNTMYVKEWNRDELMKAADIIIEQTLEEQASSVLYVDDLGDLLDGLDGQTTRGGHSLPQNMTNEECFDAALEFKLRILYGIVSSYTIIYFNNLCNDYHSGAFGYFVNEAFKQIAELQF
jgi:hypothetical protein